MSINKFCSGERSLCSSRRYSFVHSPRFSTCVWSRKSSTKQVLRVASTLLSESAPQHCVINKKDQQANFMNLMIDSSAQALLVLPRVVEPMEHRFIWGDCSTKSSTGLFQVDLAAIEAMYLFATPSATVDPLNSAGLSDCFSWSHSDYPVSLSLR